VQAKSPFEVARVVHTVDPSDQTMLASWFAGNPDPDTPTLEPTRPLLEERVRVGTTVNDAAVWEAADAPAALVMTE
jgi:hypothetical protein